MTSKELGADPLLTGLGYPVLPETERTQFKTFYLSFLLQKHNVKTSADRLNCLEVL